MIQQSTFDFLSRLSTNKHRDWINENKTSYEKARDDFSSSVSALIYKIELFDHHLADLTAAECVVRICRDVRFSKNKEPNKTNFGAYLCFGGRKSNYTGYFINIVPDECFIDSGMYKPETPVLFKIRQEINYNPNQHQEIIYNQDFIKTFGEIEGERLATAPKGYPKHHPEIEPLKFKDFFVMHNFEDGIFLQENALDYYIQIFKKTYPLTDFFNENFIR